MYNGAWLQICTKVQEYKYVQWGMSTNLYNGAWVKSVQWDRSTNLYNGA